jgi:hypothetical protein
VWGAKTRVVAGNMPICRRNRILVLHRPRSRHPDIDYVGAQAYAAALIAERCLELDPDDPLSSARGLRTTTVFGAFHLDPETGIQRGHRLAVIEWRRRRQELLLAEETSRERSARDRWFGPCPFLHRTSQR